MRTAAAGRAMCRLSMLAILIVLAGSLFGCSGGSLSGVFSGSGGGGSSGSMPPVAFAEIIGPPAEIGSRLNQQLVSAAQQKNIPVVTEKGKPSTYTVQGYLAQSNDNRSEKFSYILDVTDKSGKRVHRILGEETVPTKPGAKPWTSINQEAMQKIAAKTASDLATWLPTHSGSAIPASAPAPSSRAATRAPPSSQETPPQRTASAPPSRSTNIAAMVPPVSGAPGDGRTTLTNALRDRLRARGVHIASTGGKDVYTVNGKVTIGPAPGSMQRVRIEWRLLSPSGQDLGAVTQQSDVPKGSLDKSWGPAAQAAGNAAASEIVKLLEKNKG